MRKLAKVIDFIIIRILIFFIFFIWLMFYIKDTLTSILIALSATIIFHIIISMIKNKINNKRQLSKEDDKLKNLTINQLLFNDNETNLNFFYKLILKINATTVKKQDHIYFKHNKEDFICYLSFKINGLTKEDVLEIYKKAKNQNLTNIVIITNKYDNVISSFVKTIKNANIELISSDSIFTLMKKYDTFIEITDKKKEDKIPFSQIMKSAFSKKRFFPYVFVAIILLLSSIFSPYKIYYLIFSSIAFIFAIISLFNKTLPQNENNVFENE